MQPESFIKQGIIEMLKADSKTSPKQCLLKTSERNITAHLRSHLGQIGYSYEGKKYQIDHEYNRVGMDNIPKNLPSDCLKQKIGHVVPDIIVHLRGVEINENINANWLVIEVKKIPSFSGAIKNVKNKKQKENLKHDLQKLNCFRKDERFLYQHMASIIFSKNGVWISLDDKIEKKEFKILEINNFGL